MLNAEQIQILKGTFLLKNWADEKLIGLEKMEGLRIGSFSKKDTVFSPTHFQKELGILLSGKMRVTKGISDLVVAELTAGDIFGAAALFTEASEYVSTITARTDTEVLFISQKTLSHLINEDKQIRENYIRYLSERIRFLSGKVEVLSASTGIRKLSTFLLAKADTNGELALNLSMTELAKRLDTSRASLYRDMNQLIEKGLICREGKKIRILDRSELEKI